jgi:DNA-binding transcriptional MerR regulator
MATYRSYDDLMSGDQSDTDSFTLDDLAIKTGFDRRVIRSFIEQGLLRGPDTMGRYARYSQAHVDRLLAIKTMRNTQGLAISQVRRALLSMSHKEIQKLAQRSSPMSTSAQEESKDHLSALEYIQSIDTEPPPPNPKPKQPKLPISLAQNLARLVEPIAGGARATPIERLLDELTELTAGKARRQARGTIVHRIAITPEIELTVKGNISDEELTTLEQIADCMREILMRD